MAQRQFVILNEIDLLSVGKTVEGILKQAGFNLDKPITSIPHPYAFATIYSQDTEA